jgi:hypothetical protein
LIHARGVYDHLTVRAARGHLLIEIREDDGLSDVIARATPLGGGIYGASFRSHTGRWDPLPVGGPLEEVAEGVVDLLGPYLDPRNR